MKSILAFVVFLFSFFTFFRHSKVFFLPYQKEKDFICQVGELKVSYWNIFYKLLFILFILIWQLIDFIQLICMYFIFEQAIYFIFITLVIWGLMSMYFYQMVVYKQFTFYKIKKMLTYIYNTIMIINAVATMIMIIKNK